MAAQANPKQILETWLSTNEARLSGRFDVLRVNEWDGWQDHGIALDLLAPQVAGRMTVWADHLMTAGHSVADCEVVSAAEEHTLHSWMHVPFSDELMDMWFSALESEAAKRQDAGDER